MKSWGWSPVLTLVPYNKKTWGVCFLFSASWGHKATIAVELGSWTAPDPESTSILILAFSSSRTVRKKMLVVEITYLWWLGIAARHDEDHPQAIWDSAVIGYTESVGKHTAGQEAARATSPDWNGSRRHMTHLPKHRSYLDWEQGMKREECLMPREQNVQECSSKGIWFAERSSVIQFVCLIPQQLVLCWIQLRIKSQIHGNGLSRAECEEMQCYRVS